MKVCAILAVAMLGACTVNRAPPVDPPIAHPDDPGPTVERDGSEIVRGEADTSFVLLAYSVKANGTTDRLDAIARAGDDFIFAGKVDDGWVT